MQLCSVGIFLLRPAVVICPMTSIWPCLSLSHSSVSHSALPQLQDPFPSGRSKGPQSRPQYPVSIWQGALPGSADREHLTKHLVPHAANVHRERGIVEPSSSWQKSFGTLWLSSRPQKSRRASSSTLIGTRPMNVQHKHKR